MKYSDKGFALTKQFEGCSLKAYPDPATGGEPWTCGFGHTGKDVYEGLTINQEQADNWLIQDIQKAEDYVNTLKLNLTQGQFDALVDFAFNLGIGNLSKSTLLIKLKAGDIQGAAKEFPKWNMAGGKPLAGLTKRRLTEQELFLQ